MNREREYKKENANDANINNPRNTNHDFYFIFIFSSIGARQLRTRIQITNKNQKRDKKNKPLNANQKKPKKISKKFQTKTQKNYDYRCGSDLFEIGRSVSFDFFFSPILRDLRCIFNEKISGISNGMMRKS